MSAPEFSVVREGLHYCVLRDGEKVSGGITNYQEALRMMDKLEQRSAMKQRRCLTCQDLFMSEGAHNRMCQGCRTLSTPEGDYSLGGAPSRKRIAA